MRVDFPYLRCKRMHYAGEIAQYKARLFAPSVKKFITQKSTLIKTPNLAEVYFNMCTLRSYILIFFEFPAKTRVSLVGKILKLGPYRVAGIKTFNLVPDMSIWSFFDVPAMKINKRRIIFSIFQFFKFLSFLYELIFKSTYLGFY